MKFKNGDSSVLSSGGIWHCLLHLEFQSNPKGREAHSTPVAQAEMQGGSRGPQDSVADSKFSFQVMLKSWPSQ